MADIFSANSSATTTTSIIMMGDDSDDEDSGSYYSASETRLLTYYIGLASIPSLLGSLLILYVFGRQSSWRQSVYHRLLVGVSVSNAIFCATLVIFRSTWSIPMDTLDNNNEDLTRSDNAREYCSLQGVGIHAVWATHLYSLSLLLSFVWDESMLVQHVEPWMHMLSVGIALPLLVLPALLGWMNPSARLPGLCYAHEYPIACRSSSSKECTRADGNDLRLWYAALSGVAMITVVIWMGTVLLLLRRVSRNSSVSSTKRTWAWRGLGYAAVLALSMAGGITFFVHDHQPVSNDEQDAQTSFILALILPWLSFNQGTFHAILYLGPRWRELTAQNAPLWFFGCCRCGNEDDNTTNVKTGTKLQSQSQSSNPRSLAPEDDGIQESYPEALLHTKDVVVDVEQPSFDDDAHPLNETAETAVWTPLKQEPNNNNSDNSDDDNDFEQQQQQQQQQVSPITPPAPLVVDDDDDDAENDDNNDIDDEEAAVVVETPRKETGLFSSKQSAPPPEQAPPPPVGEQAPSTATAVAIAAVAETTTLENTDEASLRSSASTAASERSLTLDEARDETSTASRDEDSKDESQSSQLRRSTIIAPAGPLGIVITSDRKHQQQRLPAHSRTRASGGALGPPVVDEISPQSPLRHSMRVGDRIIRIDDVDTRRLTPQALLELMIRTSIKTRRFVIERDVTSTKTTTTTTVVQEQ